MQIRASWRELLARALPHLIGVACLTLASGAGAEEAREKPAPRPTASSVTVVTRQDIERRQWRTLVELLQGQPGLHVSQLGGLGQPAQVFVRGQRRGRVLVRLDGIEISDPASKDPGSVLPDLLTVDIERVEIQRGAQGVSAGNDALGGVIDIATRRGSGPATPWARVEAGGFGTYQSSGGIRGGTESVDYALSYTHLHSRGINVRVRDGRDGERDGYENDSVGGRLDLRPADGLRLGLSGRFVDSERGQDSGFVGLDDPTDTSPSTLNLFDLDGSRLDARRLFLRGEAELALFDDRWIQQLSLGYTDHANDGRVLSTVPAFVFERQDPDPDFVDPIGAADPTGSAASAKAFASVVGVPLALGAEPRTPRTNADSDSSRLELAWNHALRLGSGHELRLGAQVDSETFRASQRDEEAFVNTFLFIGTGGFASGPIEFQGERTDSSHERARNVSAFIEDRIALGDFFAEIGARVQDHDEFGSQPSYRVGLGYVDPGSQLKLFASFGTASRDPDLSIAADTTTTFASRQVEQQTGRVVGSWFDQVSTPVVMFRGTGFDTQILEADPEPEQIRAAEVGMQLPLLDGRGDAGISLFATRSRHVATRGIVSDGFQRTVFAFVDDSLRSRARGVETWLRLDVSDALGLELDYTYTRSRLEHDLGLFSETGSDIGGDPELGVPRHRANASIRYAPFERFEGWVALRYVGKRNDILVRSFFVFDEPLVARQFAFGDDVTLGAYTTFDVGFRFQLRPGVTLFARVENLFDREYNDPAQTNSPGRAGYLGLQLELGR